MKFLRILLLLFIISNTIILGQSLGLENIIKNRVIGSAGPLDPSDVPGLSHHFNEASPVMTNTDWEDIVTGKTFITGSSFSYFPFTQNSLTYYETDGSFSSRQYTGADFFDANEVGFTFIVVYKNRAEGSTTWKDLFKVGGDVANAVWGVTRDGDLKLRHWLKDDDANIIETISSEVVNDDVWRISIMTFSQETDNAQLEVYNLDGIHLSATAGTWVKTNYNSISITCFQTGGSGVNAIWVGQAEMIYYRNKIFTLSEANRVGLFLADKWGLTWVNNE